MGLLLRLFDEVSDGIAFEHFLRVENLVKILLQFFSALLDVLWTFIGDPKDLFLGEGWSDLDKKYKFLMLLYSRASCTFLS